MSLSTSHNYKPMQPSTRQFLTEFYTSPAANYVFTEEVKNTSISAVREAYALSMIHNSGRDMGGKNEESTDWGEIQINNVPCRYYLPRLQAQISSFEGNETEFPICIYYHGGGFVLGTLESAHPFCMNMVERIGIPMISVGYRLAPEFPCPAAANDCFSVFKYFATTPSVMLNNEVRIDNKSIVLIGDSAGGNLTLVVSIMARNAGLASNIKIQLPLCPTTDLRLSPFDENIYDSYKKYSTGYWLTGESMAWFRDSYAPTDEIRNTFYASPITTEDLNGLPPTLFVTESHDVLRDEGYYMYQRLQNAGNKIKYLEYSGEIHVFWLMGRHCFNAFEALNDFSYAIINALMYGNNDSHSKL